MVLNAMFFTCVVCFVLPVVLTAILPNNKIKEKKSGALRMFLLGALVYFAAEVLCRRMLFEKVFYETEWYFNLTEKMFANSLFLGVTAALVQELARLIVFLLFYKAFTGRYTDKVSVARYGLGAAWVEAIVVVGWTILQFLYQTTSDTSVLDEIGAIRAAMAGIERCIGFFPQICYALLIVTGIKTRKKTIFTMLAFFLHAVVSTLDTYLGVIGMSYVNLLIINAGFAVILSVIAFGLWNSTEREAIQDVSSRSTGAKELEG